MASQACTYNGTAFSCRGRACDACRELERPSYAEWLVGVKELAAMCGIPEETDPNKIYSKAAMLQAAADAAMDRWRAEDDEMPDLVA